MPCRAAHVGDPDDQVIELLMEYVAHAMSLGANGPVAGLTSLSISIGMIIQMR